MDVVVLEISLFVVCLFGCLDVVQAGCGMRDAGCGMIAAAKVAQPYEVIL